MMLKIHEKMEAQVAIMMTQKTKTQIKTKLKIKKINPDQYLL